MSCCCWRISFSELVHLLAHRPALLLLLLLSAGLEVVHHALQFLQHLLGLVTGAGAGQVLDLVEHVVEIALAQRILGHGLILGILVGRVLARQLTQIVLHGFAQFIHQLADLFIRGAILQSFGQGVLGVAQTPLGQRKVAVFELQRHTPHVVDGRAQIFIRAGVLKAPADRLQQQVMGEIGNGLVGRDGQRVMQVKDPRQIVCVERQHTALLDDSGGQGFGKAPAGQDGFQRLAAAFLSRPVCGDEGDPYLLASERVFGQVMAGNRAVVWRGPPWQRETVLRRVEQRPGVRRSFFPPARFRPRPWPLHDRPSAYIQAPAHHWLPGAASR